MSNHVELRYLQAPTISPHDPRFTTSYPSNEFDDEVSPPHRISASLADMAQAWPIFIQCQRTILSATQFVVDLNRAMEQKSSLGFLCDRMQELHGVIEPLVASSESWCPQYSTSSSLHSSEAVAAHSLRCMSKIKLHRYVPYYIECLAPSNELRVPGSNCTGIVLSSTFRYSLRNIAT